MIEIVILGIVQGITEFLPISSSGHLVLIPHLFGWGDQGLATDVILHSGTLTAICWYFRRDLINVFLKKDESLPPSLVWQLLVASIPAALLGYLAEGVVGSWFRDLVWVGIAFWTTGVLLYLAEKISTKPKKLRELTIGSAVLIGVSQALAILPGISRSGTTIAAGMANKLSRQSAARFSFILGIPIMLGAAVKQVIEIIKGDVVLGISNVDIAAGYVVAFVSGLVAISLLMKLVQKSSLVYFSYYLWIAGAVSLVSGLFFK